MDPSPCKICGLVLNTVFGGLFESLPALMLETLKLLMISLLRNHHCLNRSLVVCEEHLYLPRPLPYKQVVACSREDVKTVNLGGLVNIFTGDLVIT